MAQARLALDARMVGPRPHGIARYVTSLARALVRADAGWRPLLVVGPDAPADLRDEFAHVVSDGPWLSPGQVLVLPAVVAQLGVRIFHATSFASSPLLTVPYVMTLHDAIHLQRPQDYGARQAAYYRLVARPSALRAAAVISVSADARQQVARHLDIPLERIHVVYNGVDAHFSPADTPRGRGTVFTVTGPKPHKNTQVLLNALVHAPGLRLRVAGTPQDGMEDTARGLGVADRVAFLGSLDDDTLVRELRGCGVFALPSTLEGFGLPALEAMACGAPVVLSDIPVFREVGGDLARYAPALDAVAWARALDALTHDDVALAEAAARGPQRAAEFTWDRSAHQTIRVYEDALAAGPR